MTDQMGLDVVLSLPPPEFTKLGMIFALMKEKKI
jgi:hypothetical protein